MIRDLGQDGLQEGLVQEPEVVQVPQVSPPVDLRRRFVNWRTLASLAIAVLILVFALRKSDVSVSSLRAALSRVNPWLFLAAFVVYYSSFPLRTLRWRMLLLNANTGAARDRIRHGSFLGLLEILYLSWFANCVVPAKLGDVYRAYLARSSMGLSASRTVGTILAERVLDLLVLFPLLMGAALLTFRDRLLADNTIRYALFGALILGVLAGAVVLAIWFAGERLLRWLPEKAHRVFSAFREGVLHSFRRHQLRLLGLTVLVWTCEGARIYLVLDSLGLLEPGRVGLSAALFLALGSSVLTTVPFAPAGLGLVDSFLIAGFRIIKHGSTGGQAAALALLDRMISVLSIVVIGFLVYIFSKKTREALGVPRLDTKLGLPQPSVSPVGYEPALKRSAIESDRTGTVG